MTALRITVKGDREAKRLLDSLADSELRTRMRRATRAGAAVMRTDLRARAHGGSYPRSFREIATRSSARREIKTQVGPTSPLHRIFEGGAGPHTIAPSGGGSIRSGHVVEASSRHVLVNADEGFFAAHPVRHPGMAARPLTTPVFEADKDKASAAGMKTLLDGLR